MVRLSDLSLDELNELEKSKLLPKPRTQGSAIKNTELATYEDWLEEVSYRMNFFWTNLSPINELIENPLDLDNSDAVAIKVGMKSELEPKESLSPKTVATFKSFLELYLDIVSPLDTMLDPTNVPSATITTGKDFQVYVDKNVVELKEGVDQNTGEPRHEGRLRPSQQSKFPNLNATTIDGGSPLTVFVGMLNTSANYDYSKAEDPNYGKNNLYNPFPPYNDSKKFRDYFQPTDKIGGEKPNLNVMKEEIFKEGEDIFDGGKNIGKGTSQQTTSTSTSTSTS